MKTVLSLLIGVSFVLAGCASPQVRYHTLVNADPVSGAVAAPDFVIDLLPVGDPAQMFTAWQRVVERLARQIGQTATGWVATGTAACLRD
ncbi:hypothetical protein EDF73_102169 [Raoultella sp. BIGb0138]|uniref:hypothetical protein n=1 Tax=Raoultella sp. BIGb0138 TaxID=2485115 RepID=UPI00104DED43|nr:hypothetical protein [Raoultella sp. BIGb0138]TCW16365.1 hypothetical protein EDF73_102169 [Raoultella sp. BIGb0138]